MLTGNIILIVIACCAGIYGMYYLYKQKSMDDVTHGMDPPSGGGYKRRRKINRK
jgi:hypothetical protein